MKNLLNDMRRGFNRWMIGRYGADELSVFMFRAAIVIMLLSCIPKLNSLSILAWVVALIGMYRSFSKKITARGRERDIYLKLLGRFKSRINTYKLIWRDRNTYKYFKCPKCKSFVRVPKGKGNIEITCTKCRTKMMGRS